MFINFGSFGSCTFSFEAYAKNVRQKATKGSLKTKCNLWVHINFLDYLYLNGNDEPLFCLKCNTELFPFGTLNNETFN